MKFIAGLFLLLAIVTAKAQPNFDAYAQQKAQQLAAPTTVSATTTNTPQDMHEFIGVCALYVSVVSNTAAGAPVTFTFRVEEAVSPTNAAALWTTVTNVALGTWSSVAVTNYAQTLITTNILSTAAASTAEFTNSSSQAIVAPAILRLGIPVREHNRYLRTVYTIGGAGSNSTWSVNSLLVGRNQTSN